MDTEPVPGVSLDTPAWKKSMSLWDGFVLNLPLTTGVFATSGFMIGTIGAWGALFVCLLMCVVAFLSNFLFAEMATMYPEKPGSLSAYAREAFRYHFKPLTVLAGFGYWLGYSICITFVAFTFGELAVHMFMPETTWSVQILGSAELGAMHFFALGCVILCWVLASLHVKVMARLSLVIGVLMAIFCAIAMIGPWVTGSADTSFLTWNVTSVTEVLVWAYVAGWTLFGSELSAAFAPEYRNPKKDVPRVLMLSATYTLIFYSFTPFSAAAQLGADQIGENALIYGPLTAASVLGGSQVLENIFVFIFMLATFMATLIFMSDCGRATASMAEDGESITQFGTLNRFGAPVWGIAFAAIVNLIMIWFVGIPIAVVLASNIGYILVHCLANWGFVFLRYTRPNYVRPIKLHPVWMPIAIVVGLFHFVILYVGIVNPQSAGYGGFKETMIGIGFLFLGLVLWIWRVVVQDKKPLTWKDPKPADYETGPYAAAAGAVGAQAK